MFTQRLRVRQVALLAVVLVLALAGCTALNTGAAVTDPPDAGTVEQRYANLTGVSGVVNSTVVYENGSTVTERIHQRFNPQTGYSRSRVIGPSGPAVGDVFSFNGTVIWEYDASRNEVTTVPYDERNGSVGGGGVLTSPEVFQFLQDESTVQVDAGDGEDEIDPLPAVPVTRQPDSEWIAENETYTVDYQGTATVDGRTTYVVELTAAGEWVANRTIHYDAEWFYPVKSTVEVDGPSESYTIRASYEDISFNPGLDERDFRFDPPADATVINRSHGPKISDTYEDLTDRPIVPAPGPEFPSEFTFQSGYEQFGDFSGVQVLTYADDEGEYFTIAIFESEGVVDSIRDQYETEPVALCGIKAYSVNGSTDTELVWSEPPTEYGPSTPPKQYRIWGTADEETMLTVARSIQC